MQTEPLLPICATTRLATVAPALKLMFDAVGLGVPHGKTVTKPGCFGSVTVTLSTAAFAVSGTAGVPAICRINGGFASRPAGSSSMSAMGGGGAILVSRNRVGLSDTNAADEG